MNLKKTRREKNRMLMTSQEAGVIKKLQEKREAMSKMMADLGLAYEVQVSTIQFVS